ncbi:MAG TPA: hypothetical protein VNY73_05875 [Bacteroidia bacterium]|jgi:hypothetical protein|nr:hypothetical protein [Bacteroidia bacterium]
MKKLIYTGKILTILSLVVLAGCKKDSKVAFPSKSTSNGTYGDFVYGTPTLPTIMDADGILAAIHVHNYRIVTISPVEKEYQYGMAMFANTTGNFSSLTNADSVWINGMVCANTNNTYLSDATTYSIGLGGTVSWNVKGAGSVPAMTNSVPSGDPAYAPFSISSGGYLTDTWLPTFTVTLTTVTRKPTTGVSPPVADHSDTVLYWGISAPHPNHPDSVRWKADSSEFRNALTSYQTTLAKHIADSVYNITPYAYIPLKVSNSSGSTAYLSNTDTVFVIYNDGAGFSYTRKVPATDTTIALRPSDFNYVQQSYKTSNFIMQMNLVKYYPVTSGSKKYYYLKMGSYIRYWRTS